MDYPDSQPFFTEVVTESQLDVKRKKYNESDEVIYVESQSILLPTITHHASNTGSGLGICGTQVIKKNLESPYENELASTKVDINLRNRKENRTTSDKIEDTLDDKENETISDKEDEIISDKEDIAVNNNENEILGDKKDEVISDDDAEKESVNNKLKTTSSMCVFCVFDKDLDKRNYYFGNLLIGELQFLPPCMRSEAYRKILELIDSLKHKHRSKVYETR